MSFADRFAGAYERACTHEVELPTLPGMAVRVRELGPVDCLAHSDLFSTVVATLIAVKRGDTEAASRPMRPEDIQLLQKAVCASVVSGSEPPAEGAERAWEPLRFVMGEPGEGELSVGMLHALDLWAIWMPAVGAGRRAADSVASFRGRARGVDGGGPDGGGDGPPGPVPPLATAVDG